MSWTEADEARYQELLRERARLAAQEQGDRALAEAKAATPQRVQPRPEEKRDWSTWRVTVGAVRDAAEGIIGAVQDLDDAVDSIPVVGRLLSGKEARERVAEAARKADPEVSTINSKGHFTIPNLEGSEQAGTPEKVVRNIGSFMIPFTALGKAAKITEAATVLGRMGKAVGVGSIVNFVNVDPVENNLATFVKDTFKIDDKALDYIASADDDSGLESRLKSVVANLPLDFAAEGLFEAGAAGLRAYKQARSMKQEVADAVQATQMDLTITRKAKADANVAAEAAEAAAKAPAPAAAAAPPEPRVVTPDQLVDAPKGPTPAEIEAKAKAEGEGALVTVPVSQVKPQTIETLDQFTDYVRKLVGEVPQNAGKRLERLAKALTENPHNALDELSIDPVKLDYSLFSDPKHIQSLQESLGSLVDEVAAKTGRTGKRVSNVETLATGRLLGQSPKVLKQLVENTRGLAGKMTAARILVGHHAHKLTFHAEEAMKEITAGKGGTVQWGQFLEALDRHTVLLGTLRGAGSEVGRALQSLQALAPVKEARETVAEQAVKALEAVQAEAAEAVQKAAEKAAVKDAAKATRKADKGSAVKADARVARFLEDLRDHSVNDALLKGIADTHKMTPDSVLAQLGIKPGDVKKLRDAEVKYNDLFKDLTTQASRLRLLNQLKAAKGDLQRLTRITRARDLNFLGKLDAVIKDTTGNLFSVGTATANVVGAGLQLGLKTMTHALASASHLGIAAVSGSTRHSLAARQHFLKAWASVHAPVMAFGDAMSNTWAILQKEGLEELSMLADTAGFERFAMKAQAGSVEAGAKLQNGLVREDAVMPKGWYIGPERIAQIMEQAEQYPLGKFGEMGLQWLTRAVASTLNAGGALSRMGTTVFINAPDQFAGALAARVGAHSAAVDKAAAEAAEAGLEGKPLYEYIKARAIQLSDGIDGISPNPFDDGAREVVESEGQQFAQGILFQDDLEWGASRAMAGLPNMVPVLGTLLVPFPRTPLRILERTLIDHTPLGLLKDRVREAWASGDAEVRGEIAARYTLATSILLTAYYLASDRTIVGFDGGPASSARLSGGRGSYTLRIGDDVVEFGRLDPLGTVLGFGADLRAAMDFGQEDDETGIDAAQSVFEAALWATFKNILTKTWMTSLRQLTELMASRNLEEFEARGGIVGASYATRLVPGSGVQRQFDKWDEGIVRESAGFIEGLLKSSWGSAALPTKRDYLGRPLQVTEGEALLGIRVGHESVDPLVSELESLSFDLPPIMRRVKGVRLTSSEMSRWLELRGQVVRDASGLTMEEKLREIVAEAEYQQLGRNGRVEVIRGAMQGYAKLATDALLKDNDRFTYRVLRQEVRDDFRARDRGRDEADAETERLGVELGLRDYRD